MGDRELLERFPVATLVEKHFWVHNSSFLAPEKREKGEEK